MKRTYWTVLFLIIIGVLFSACGNAGQVDVTETPEKVNTLATIQALGAQTTLVPPTPMGGVAVEGPDDYVGIIKQAWNIIDTEYVRDNFNGADWPAIYDEYIVLAEDVTSSEELWNLLGEMVGELDDSHSRHVPPDRMTAEFGIDTAAAGEARAASGIEIWPGPSREDGYLTVWNVCAQSVAAQAGITRGDIITAIDGNPVVKEGDDFKREDRTAVIFGTGGDQVTLTVWQGPNQDPVDITLTLDGVGGCPYRYYEVVLEDPRIGYIRVPDFDGDSAFA
ncbi:MAG: PDZ domain-containing protein, partial [Anaerolineales bacterium]|nr:PDZ domain-containing protein [Anaerolineales bacterium]